MLLPKKLQSAVLEGLFAVGRAQVSPVFLSDFNPIASARISEMQRILREGHSLQLQFPAEDLGFRLLLLGSNFRSWLALFSNYLLFFSKMLLDCIYQSRMFGLHVSYSASHVSSLIFRLDSLCTKD